MEHLVLIPENIESISQWLKFFVILGPFVIVGFVIMTLFHNDFSRWKGSETRRRLDRNFDEYEDTLELSRNIFEA